ncbi:MAG: hypothetical protein FJ288_13455 [Planctomycetes bacterium]|nr:hypothetical protein [Planctomycetota bacterium]
MSDDPQPQPLTTSDRNASSAGPPGESNPLPPIYTGPQDSAGRPPSHFPTRVGQLQDLRREIEEARLQGVLDTDRAAAALRVLDDLVRLVGQIAGA